MNKMTGMVMEQANRYQQSAQRENQISAMEDKKIADTSDDSDDSDNDIEEITKLKYVVMSDCLFGIDQGIAKYHDLCLFDECFVFWCS